MPQPLLGSSICEAAVKQGFQVLSLSRRGSPNPSNHPHPGSPTGPVTAAPLDKNWTQAVEWIQGDALHPETYASALRDCDAVVHTVGTLLEADYKTLVKANSICQLITKSTTPTKPGPSPGISYETINRDTALAVAAEAAKHPKMKSFVYISASDVFPFISSRYISTKREAEAGLLQRPEFRTVILRPGFMYSESQPFTVPVARALSALGCARNMALGWVSRTHPITASGLTTPPLPIGTVAQAALQALRRKNLTGVVNPDGIVELAQQK
ncbi:hypothetical protein BJ085DRAFT_16734 [Dimargaris cristalligena]|uniref:NAD(P)-binding domain-containing protein n=1 Tax=Dimargaris cristalligena TaxID=215637 RepID=A0A4P9ZWD1_9FUNG|nr:hypothetical protein BJ085DRAFT_16734 [Dimargaris cristalligena]|eukprot:RKP37944.1 hypothetical protein BJ085DRAFT_16734 [Dimargaris cristalligena]